MRDSKHISKDRLCALFSQARLRGYVDCAEHEANLALIGKISHKIGILEIILRNSIDGIIKAQNPLWLESLPLELKMPKEINSTRDKIVSLQSLGFWVRVVEHYRIHNRIFGVEFLDNLDLRKYYEKNKDSFKSKHNRIMRHHKVSAILQLLRLIRNRAFHFENLYKFTENGYPRLNVKITNKYKESVYIAICPNKIITFLNDLIANFDKDLIYYAENTELVASAT
ncbi:hypothetical protein [Helicobacter sp. 23-1045]